MHVSSIIVVKAMFTMPLFLISPPFSCTQEVGNTIRTEFTSSREAPGMVAFKVVTKTATLYLVPDGKGAIKAQPNPSYVWVNSCSSAWFYSQQYCWLYSNPGVTIVCLIKATLS